MSALVTATIEGNQVSISTEVKKEKEEKQGDKVLRSERYYGKVARTLPWPRTWMKPAPRRNTPMACWN